MTTLLEHTSGSRGLRAPQEDGQTLIDPSWESLPAVVARNRGRLSQADYDLQGRSLTELAAAARRGLLHQAVAYTSQYRNVPTRWRDPELCSCLATPSTNKLGAGHKLGAGLPTPPAARQPSSREHHPVPFVLAGHQPQLFHPGVWYKNFVLGALGKQVEGVAIHLLIDSDLCRTAAIRVPTGSVERPHVDVVPYDEPSAEVPYEERFIRDAATFTSFGQRTAGLIRPFVPSPLVESLWPLMLERHPRQTNLGLRLAQGRHALEETWRNDTLELPQSAVCGLPEFSWFLAHMLANLPRFWTAYNDALAVYRRENRLRNRAHPVPDLTEHDGWLEAPFWIWSADDPRRRPLFARQVGDEIQVSDRGSRSVRLSLSADRDAAVAVEQLQEAAGRGIKIRTRALTTTLFARLVLGDVFLHGIGGAKYDQVTDQLARTFFGFELPEFAAVSATLRLPIEAEQRVTASELDWQRQLRELRYHPERFLDGNGANLTTTGSSEAAAIVASKRRWVTTPKTLQNAHERHVGITTANQALQPFVADARRAIERQREQTQQRKRADAILRSRDYSFCLFPREHFERLLGELV